MEIDLDSSGKRIHTYPADARPEGATLNFVKVDGTWKVAEVVRNTD